MYKAIRNHLKKPVKYESNFFSPSNAKVTFLQVTKMQNVLKTI